MKNTLLDLNNHLFEQMERLNDDELQGEALEQELHRSKAMNGIARCIIDNASLALEAIKFQDDRMDADSKLPMMLTGEKE